MPTNFPSRLSARLTEEWRQAEEHNHRVDAYQRSGLIFAVSIFAGLALLKACGAVAFGY